MAFYGQRFSFNGVSSYEHGLMIYDFGNATQGDGSYSSPISVVEDRINRRHSGLFYGFTQHNPLEYVLVFGVDENNEDRQLDRYDIEVIGSWLTGVNGYRWLEIEQPDMETVRYKCIISELKILTTGWASIAFQAKILCDSPFAYSYCEEYEYNTTTSQSVSFFNKSSGSYPFKPRLEITLPAGSNSVSIINHSDNDREFKFLGVPNTGGITIFVDNENQIITSNVGTNMYPFFNFNFLKLKKGDNQLSIMGNSTVKFICEFPINVGG